MSVPLTVSGVSYTYPESGDAGLASQATGWAQAVTTAIAPLVAKPYAAYGDSNTTVPSGATTIINFNTLVQDASNCVTTGASWKFTVPTGMGGQYAVSAAVISGSLNTSANGEFQLLLYKNGSLANTLAREVYPSLTAVHPGASGSTIIQLAAGDYIDVRVNQTFVANLFPSGLSSVWITIKGLI